MTAQGCEPEDGDLVQSPPKIEVPADVAEAVRTLIRFDPERAQVWLNENSLFAGVKMLLGADPKQDYKDKVAEVELGSA